MIKPEERIVITGMGVLSPLGNCLEEFHQNLVEGKNGISEIEYPWSTGYKINHAGIVRDSASFHTVDLGQTAQGGRTTGLATAAVKTALANAEIEIHPMANRIGLVVGTAFGEAPGLEDEINDGIPTHDKPQSELGRMVRIQESIAENLGIIGPRHLVTTTCASGNHAISWAADLLKMAEADVMIAVGADTIGYVDMLGFSRLLLQAPEKCQPFDLHRKGTILSEGAGALVLESASFAKRRGADILAEVGGCGLSCDAAGPFESKASETASLELAANKALSEARVRPEDVQYVSAHGSGTRLNDVKETNFLKRILGEHARNTPVSSIKSMLGHAQGAAASFEAIACVLSFKHNILYPTTNYETPDPKCDLDYIPNEARESRVETVMSNAFGVGGNNAIIIFKKWKGN